MREISYKITQKLIAIYIQVDSLKHDIGTGVFNCYLTPVFSHGLGTLLLSEMYPILPSEASCNHSDGYGMGETSM